MTRAFLRFGLFDQANFGASFVIHATWPDKVLAGNRRDSDGGTRVELTAQECRVLRRAGTLLALALGTIVVMWFALGWTEAAYGVAVSCALTFPPYVLRSGPVEPQIALMMSLVGFFMFFFGLVMAVKEPVVAPLAYSALSGGLVVVAFEGWQYLTAKGEHRRERRGSR
ncbi:MAG: hypothetical protein M9886_04000 [Candidatus Nanopelagicales bacterium]|nr:hypothetical protein [Candidatus Nanopelagicales bacterium]